MERLRGAALWPRLVCWAADTRHSAAEGGSADHACEPLGRIRVGRSVILEQR
jgi:hypothetical protein